MQTAEAIIYVAGNPRLYPLEYYDVGSGTYEGAIPDFLGRFAAEYGYDLRYFEPQEADSRRDLAANLQVDLISGVQSGESYPNTAGEPLLLFEAGAGGAETAYQLLFTGAAPESFRAQLREFAARTSQAEWTGELLESAAEPRQGGSAPVWPFWAACLAAAVLAAALFTALWRLRRERNLTVRLRSTDPETGLGTEDALERAFSHLQRDQSRRYYYLLYFCLGLDRVGYMWGQEQAGALLQHAAQTLKGASAAGDVLARSGCGDLLVLRRFLDSAEAESWARAALEDIRAFPSAGERLGDGDISVGVCPLSAEYLDFSQAVFHAHQCALAALRLKAPCRTCCTEQCRLCQERWLLLSDFDRALERGEFQLYLQFFVNAYNFRVVGGEALSRWKHPQLGVLSPDRYIPLLEEDGRIAELDLRGMESACAFLQELDRLGVDDFFISCNFARCTFSAPDFVGRCVEIIDRYSFTRKLLILEITESQLTSGGETAQMLKNIVALRDHGLRVIFDDFGMGFSSFHDLQDYPMDGLKLDKELVDNMWTEQGEIILSALVDTGHRMGLTILAEGVETDRQIEALQKLHCDVLQGFRFCIPLPAGAALERILNEARPRAQETNQGV